MKLQARTILETLLVGAFKDTPNICDLLVGSRNSVLLENPAQKIINNSARVLACEKPLDKKKDNLMFIMTDCLFYACSVSLRGNLNTTWRLTAARKPTQKAVVRFRKRTAGM